METKRANHLTNPINSKRGIRRCGKSYLVILLCLLALFSSCDNDSNDEDYRYTFGLTSAINGNNEEMEAIETAYCDAYNNAGLKYSSQLFAPGTSKDEILKACNEAENAILTSSTKFEGKYTYEVKYTGRSIYSKNYGTR